MKKLLALLLAAAMVLSMAACGGNNSTPATTAAPAAETEAPAAEAEAPAEEAGLPVTLTGDYDEDSAILYEYVLGDFIAAYDEAKAVDAASEAWAKMAIAEAKLLQSGVMVPLRTQGGRYALSSYAPYGVTPILYGNDQDRYQNMMVVDKFIANEDWDALKVMWNELKGTGTYQAEAKAYLADKGYTLKDTYNIGYSSDPKTWDYLATSRAADSEAIVNGVEMLFEYDCEGVQQPALAESVEVSEDGLTYTFKIREGLSWVDSQGRKVADVKADDFVAGFQHMLDAMGGLEFLVDGIVKGVHEYINAEDTDFANVGVAAPDDTTLVYTLAAPCRYFMTMLGYNPFAPMSRDYYVSMGGKFGAEYDPSAADYKYGTSVDTIAYVGPYRVTNHTAENTIVFSANESYWNAENINIKTITWLYNDGSVPTKAYDDAKAHVIDGCGLTTAQVELAKADGLFDDYAHISGTTATSYMSFMNVNRAVYANVNDESAAVSAKTDDQKDLTKVAMLSKNFRLALATAWDHANYNAQSNGEDLKLNSLRNSYTPGNFVSLTEDVTVDINGTATTFPAGTAYGAVMQAQMDADACPIKVYDPAMDNGAGSSDGFDGWHNVDVAKAFMAKAVEEIASWGYTIDESNPVVIDLPYPSNSEVYTNCAQAVKQSIEGALTGLVVVNLVECVDYQQWYYTGYYTDFGYEANYDTYDLSGWGPDYGDPSTYLDTFLPDYAGYMIKCIGIY